MQFFLAVSSSSNFPQTPISNPAGESGSPYTLASCWTPHLYDMYGTWRSAPLSMTVAGIWRSSVAHGWSASLPTITDQDGILPWLGLVVAVPVASSARAFCDGFGAFSTFET